MGTVKTLGSGLSFEKYRTYLKRTAEKLHELRPTSIVSLARKGPRLLQLMKEMGISLPAVPHWSDHALDFLTRDDIGSTPVIFDDVVILGTSLHSLQQRIRSRFDKMANVVAVVADSDNLRREFIELFHSTVFLDEANTQAFSSELIRTIPLLGLPYDLDHPIFSFKTDASQDLLDDLLGKCTYAHKECLSAQHEDKVDVLTLHYDPPSGTAVENLRELIGNPDLFKIKVIRSRVRSDIRFVPVCCFPPIHKKRLSGIWGFLDLPDMDGNHLAMYRILCFVGALSHAETCDERLDSSSFLIHEARLTLGRIGADAIEPVYSAVQNPNRSRVSSLSDISTDPLENNADGNVFNHTNLNRQDLVPEFPEDAGYFERLSDFWRNVFHEIELPFRKKAKELLDAGESIQQVLDQKEAKRLMSGFPARQIFKLLALNDRLERSLAFDLPSVPE